MESFYLSNIDGIYVIVFSVLIGIELIKNVPAVLHTPLMSGANAISGIIVIGGIIHLLTLSLNDLGSVIAASLAVVIGTINVSGGFFVTNRMLAMFTKPKNKK